MDRLYFVVSVNGALFTLNALRPRTMRSRWLFIPSFAASLLTIELAWMHLLAQLAVGTFFARRGALRTGWGRLGFLVQLASLGGTVALLARSVGVRHEVRAAFAEAARAGERAERERQRQRLGVRITRNVTYADIGPTRLALDVYQPRRPQPAPGPRRPAIVQIHGGAWVFGDKREQGIPLLWQLAGEGWVGFNVNYRLVQDPTAGWVTRRMAGTGWLAPGPAFPDQLIDLKRAIAWIREHADDYGIDPDFIVVTGGSAGGHLAALLALTANDPRYQPGFEDADTSLQACVPFYGVYDLTNRGGHYPDEVVKRFFGPVVLGAELDREPETFAAASPVDRIHAGAPPFLVVHGDADTIVPVAIAREFVQELRAVSEAPVLYLELKGAQHAFDLLVSIRGQQVVRAVERFIGTLWERHQAGQAPADVPAGELREAVDSETTVDEATA
jgi:acetyl esterase/lipase